MDQGCDGREELTSTPPASNRSHRETLGVMTKGQVLVVACGKTYFGIPAEIVRGIARPEQAGPLHDRPHPPVDLGSRLGLIGSSLSPESRIILCGAHEVQEGLRVDHVMGLTKADGLDLRPLPPLFTGRERQWFRGLFLFQDTVAMLLDSRWVLQDHGRAPAPEVPGTAA